MASRAVWRARPDDPRTTLGWFLRFGTPKGIPLPFAFFLTVVIGALVVAGIPWALLVLPIVLLSVRRPPAPVDLTLFRTLPPPGPAFVCRLSVERGEENLITGIDDGIVTFVDGWLHYAGLRTEFSIRAKDVRGFGETPTTRLLLGDVTVAFATADPESQNTLARAASVWYRSSVAEGEESVFPPKGVHVSGLAHAWVESARSVSINLACGFLLVIILRALLGAEGFAYFGFFFATGFGGTFGRLRALRRLAQEDRRLALSAPVRPVVE